LQIEQKFVKITENNSNNNSKHMETEKASIKFNVGKDSSIKINSDKTFMKDVEQNVNGGTIEHRATEELTQIGNTMQASDGGKILNEVDGGKLNQQDNQMTAERGGTIINKVIKNGKTMGWFLLFAAIIGFWNDIQSLIKQLF